MGKKEYKFVYQSRLQRFYYALLILASFCIGLLPAGILSRCLDNPDFVGMLPDWLILTTGGISLVLAVIGAFVGGKIGMGLISAGTMQLYSDYATLDYGKNKNLVLKKDEFRIRGGSMKNTRNGSGNSLRYWNIRKGAHTVRFYEAVINSRKRIYNPSLSRAISALEASGLPALPRELARASKKNSSRNDVRTVKIGKVIISMGISTPEVFANSPYYVDYSSCVAVKSVPLCTCLVREVSDPEHVVGDIGFADDEENETPISEAVLNKSIIVDGTALDERIGTE